MKKGLFLFFVLSYFTNNAWSQQFPRAKCTTLLGEAMFGEKEDTLKSRGMADNYHTWEPGTVLQHKIYAGWQQEHPGQGHAACKRMDQICEYHVQIFAG